MKYEMWKSKKDGNWYWHLKASNGERVAYGEGYLRKTDCLTAINLVKSSGNATVYNLTPSEVDS